MYFDNDIIASRATPPGESAIAVVRMSGSGSLEVMRGCLKDFNGGIEPRKATLVRLGDESGEIDQAVVIYYRSPKSYTGEDLVEIHCHGGEYIVGKVLNFLYSKGARAAEPGEFTFRAFLNGKMDLTQAEAVADIIAAESESGRRNALMQLYGGLTGTIKGIREGVMDILAEVEAEIEFPEDEPVEIDYSGWKLRLLSIKEKIDKIIEHGKIGKPVREGFRVTIAGPPNSGKSTLLNALLGEDRAIVHRSAGTTRDVLRESTQMGGIKVWLNDTAGLRDGAEEVETKGIERARKEIKMSDLVIYLFDLGVGLKGDNNWDYSKKDSILVGNKVDLYGDSKIASDIKISALRGDGLDELKEIIERRAFGGRLESGVIANERHLELLKKSGDSISEAVKLVETERESEIIALELREAAAALGKIVGEGVTEEVLERIFSRFCIGK